MTGDRDGSVRAIFLAAIMVLSVMVMGVAFAGSAGAAQETTTHTVAPGEDTGDYSDIQNAIDNATSSDVIDIEAGSYDGPITIDVADLTLKGPNAGTPGDESRVDEAEINAAGSKDAIHIAANDVVIDGLKVTDISDSSNDGIEISQKSGPITINNSVIEGFNLDSDSNQGTGIYLEDDSDSNINAIIINNSFKNNFAAVGGTESTTLEIRDNKFVGNVEGIGLGGNVQFAKADGIKEVIDANNFDVNVGEGERSINDWRNSVSFDGEGNIVVDDDVEYAPGTRIQDAIAAIKTEGITSTREIQVSPGSYEEKIEVSVGSLTLRGPNSGIHGDSDNRNSEATIIPPEGEAYGIGITETGLDEITIEGFTVKGGTTGGIVQGSGAHSSTTVNVRNNIIKVPDGGWSSHGNSIQVSGNESTVTANYVEGTGYNYQEDNYTTTGIITNGASSAVIKDNVVELVDEGVSENHNGIVIGSTYREYFDLPRAEDVEVKNNTVTGFTNGITVSGGVDNTEITKNELDTKEVGIATNSFEFGDQPSDVPTGTQISDNSISLESGSIGVESSADELDAENLDLAKILEINTFNQAVTVQNGNGDIITKKIYGGIQAAVDDASSDQTVSIGPGTYDENVAISTPNVTLDGEGNPVINGRIDIKTDEVTVQDLTVRHGAPSGSSEVEGIFVGNSSTSGFDDRDSKVTIQDVTVEDIHPHGTSEALEGIHIKHYDEGENIDGVEIDNVKIQNVSQPANGANAIKLQAGIENISVENSNFADIRGDWSYGITVTPSGGESGNPQSVSITHSEFENISATGDTKGIGLGIGTVSGDYEENGGANPEEIDLWLNNFEDNGLDVINKNGSGYLDATLNWWDSKYGPIDLQNGSSLKHNTFHDPFLTAPYEEVDDPENIQKFGSEMTLSSGANTIAFPAPSERSLNETIRMDSVEAVWQFDNSEGIWTQVTDNPTPSALDTYVVVVEEDGWAPVVMEFDNTDSEKPVPGAADVSGGWNFISPTQAGNSSSEAFTTNSADVQTTLSESPFTGPRSQPFGVNYDHTFSPYRGYWTFIDQESEDSSIAANTYSGVTYEEFTENVLFPNKGS